MAASSRSRPGSPAARSPRPAPGSAAPTCASSAAIPSSPSLARRCATASTKHRTLLLNVVGESGVGKSRLIDELLDTLDQIGAGNTAVLEGVCAPYGESNVWSPIATAIAGHLGFDPALSVDELRERALGKASRLLATDGVTPEVERAVEAFLHLLGHESALDALDGTVRRDAVHRAITRVVEMRAAKGPLVLWIDDLHWADQVVVDLLEHLVGAVQRLPFVLVTSMRPGSDVLWPPPTDRTIVLSLTVQPLARADSDELAIELLGQLTGAVNDGHTGETIIPDQKLLGALFDRSGGNPLFLQQLAGVVAEEGPSSELPDSLRALIAARLDQLNVTERQVLDNAADARLVRQPDVARAVRRRDQTALRSAHRVAARREGFPRRRRAAVAVPQRLGPRDHVPDPHQGVARPAARRGGSDARRLRPDSDRRPRSPRRDVGRAGRRARPGRPGAADHPHRCDRAPSASPLGAPRTAAAIDCRSATPRGRSL